MDCRNGPQRRLASSPLVRGFGSLVLSVLLALALLWGLVLVLFVVTSLLTLMLPLARDILDAVGL